MCELMSRFESSCIMQTTRVKSVKPQNRIFSAPKFKFNFRLTISKLHSCITCAWPGDTTKILIFWAGFDSRLEPIAFDLYYGWLLIQKAQAHFAFSLKLLNFQLVLHVLHHLLFSLKLHKLKQYPQTIIPFAVNLILSILKFECKSAGMYT